MSATVSYVSDEFTEAKELDAIDQIDTKCTHPSRRRRRNDCSHCELLKKEIDALRKKYDEAIKKIDGVCVTPRRENRSPLTILLFVLNEQRLSRDAWNILDYQCAIETQCQMLLHNKNENIVRDALDQLPVLDAKDKQIIQSAISNYHGIVKSTSGAKSTSTTEFILNAMDASIERSGRIQNVVTAAFWQCVHYLTLFMDESVDDFERYITRYVPLTLPTSITDDVRNKYKYIFSNNTFDRPLGTLRDVIHSLFTQSVEPTPPNDPFICGFGLDEEDIVALKQQHQQIVHSKPYLDPNTPDYVPSPVASNVDPISPKTPRIPDTIFEDMQLDMPSPTASLMSPVTPHSPATSQLMSTISACSMSPSSDSGDSECKSTTSVAKDQYNKRMDNFKPKSGNRSKSNFYISREMIAAVAKECIEFKNENNSGLVFDYFKNSAAMQINDGQIDNIIHTPNGPMLILNIDLHFHSNHIMYLIAVENHPDFRDRVRWCIQGFTRARDIYNTYHVRKLPLSSRKMKWYLDGLARPPCHVPLSVIAQTNFKTLKAKNTKRKGAGKTKSKLRLSQEKFRRCCQDSWYDDGLMVPAVVIKGKKQWIEWKKFIKVYDEWVGISLRYHKSNRQWKIGCLEYDAGRIYYQHRLVGLTSPIDADQINRHITTSLDIV
eukprot:524679_1